MECNSCSIQLTNILLCRVCSLTFCSNSCVLTHFDTCHSINTQCSSPFKLFSNLKYKKIEALTTLSPFIKPGKYLSEAQHDPTYSYEHLSQISYNGIPFLLGSGSFGDVYLAEHKHSHKKVAIKKMNKKRIESGLGSLEVIRNEISIHSRLVHEHIIKLLNVTEDSHSISIILEFASKGNLYALMQKTKGMSEDKAFKFFIQTTSAIHFLHLNSFIHRDIKPENLLLDENDNIKLADFGWCNEVATKKRSTFCGTIEYMAPEIVNNQYYDAAVDTWSLGILLYELIHGYSPFRGKDMNQVMSNIKEHKLVFHKAISKECKELITQLLSVNPLERPKTSEIFTHSFVVKYAPNDIKADAKLLYSNSSIYERTLPSKSRRIESFDRKEPHTEAKPHTPLESFKRNLKKERIRHAKEAKNLLNDFNKEAKKDHSPYDYITTQLDSSKKKDKNKSSSVTKARISIEDFLSITCSPEKPKQKLVKKVNMIIHRKKKPLIGDDKENNGNITNHTTDASVTTTIEANKKETYPDPSKLKDFFSKILGV